MAKPNSYSLDVAIATRNGYLQLIKCVTNILANRTLPNNLIIIDNNSEPSYYFSNKIKYLCKEKGVKLQYHIEPDIGLSQARNEALKRVTSRYFAFVDQDEYVHPMWIGTLILLLQQRPEVDVISGMKYSTQPENYWNAVWDAIYKPGSLYKGEVDFVTSSNSCYKTSFVAKNNLQYDKDFRQSSEDVVFSKKLKGVGAKMYFTPEMWLLHDFRDNLSDFSKQWFGYGKSMNKFHIKYETKNLYNYFLNILKSLYSHKINRHTKVKLIPGFIILNFYFALGYIYGIINSFYGRKNNDTKGR